MCVCDPNKRTPVCESCPKERHPEPRSPLRRLVVTAGLPRSGKSSWARGQGAPIVNPDSIRLAIHGQRFHAPAEPLVWAMAEMMVDALFRAGHAVVIVDATNVSLKRRVRWQDAADRNGASYEIMVIDTSPECCRARALEEHDEMILPVIDRMAREWDLARPAAWGAR